jgi:hypothetical protein
MNTTTNLFDIGSMVTRGAKELGGLASPRFRIGGRSNVSLAEDLAARRPLFVEMEWYGLGGYLFAWTATLSFCWGLCGLAISPTFEVLVPRWFMLAYGTACVLMALLAPFLRRSLQQRQTSGHSDRFPMGNDATAISATVDGSTARVTFCDARRAA